MSAAKGHSRHGSLALHVPDETHRVCASERILLYLLKHGSNPKTEIRVALSVRKMARIWGITASAVSQAATKLEVEGRIERVEPPLNGVHGGRYILRKPLKSQPLVKRVFYLTDIMYWWARNYQGYVDLAALAQALGAKRPAMQRALRMLREDGVISCRRIGKSWAHVMLHPLRPYHKDIPGMRARRLENSLETFPKEFFDHLQRTREQLNSPASTPPPSSPLMPLKALTSFKALTTLSDVKANLDVQEEEKRNFVDWSFEVRDSVFEIHKAERMMDPCAELSVEPWVSGAIVPNPKATAKLRGLMLMAGKKPLSVQEMVRANVRSTGVRSAASMPSMADDSRTKTLYRVGTAKLRVLLEAFQTRDEDYSLASADNSAVRSPRIGWQCEAWVKAYLAGGDYDPYELDFDENSDARFRRWRAGVTWVAEREEVWEEFWNVVKLETRDLTGKLFADEQLRTIEQWVWFGGDLLADEIGHRTGADAWLAAGRVIGEWVYRPMHHEMREKFDRKLTADEEQWVTLFAIGFANKYSPLLSGSHRSSVLLTLACIRHESVWGLSSAMLERLGIEGDYEAIRQEGLALLKEHKASQRDGLRLGGSDPLFAANFSVEALQQAYGDNSDDEALAMADFRVDRAEGVVTSRFSRSYYAGLHRQAERAGVEQAAETLAQKMLILGQAEAGDPVTMEQCALLAERVPGYEEEPPPEMEWALCLKGKTRTCSAPTETG